MSSPARECPRCGPVGGPPSRPEPSGQPSSSAEDGLGQAKREGVADYKEPVELQLMRPLKHLLDPAGLMNPGKVLPDP